MSEFKDITITCKDCHTEFVWSSGEQEFYAAKGFQQVQRCPECRKARKAQKQNRQE